MIPAVSSVWVANELNTRRLWRRGVSRPSKLGRRRIIVIKIVGRMKKMKGRLSIILRFFQLNVHWRI